MKKNTANIVIFLMGVLLFISFGINLWHLQGNSGERVIGTYLSGDELTGNGEYFVFEHNDTYVKYCQFQVLEKGDYRLGENNIYILQNETNQATTQVLYLQNNIYAFRMDEEILIYRKISNKPMFLNVDVSDS